MFYCSEMDMKPMENIRSVLEFEYFDCSDELCKKKLLTKLIDKSLNRC